ncbi:DEAD/DEAH box helicase family protein, partial [Streptomyces sp. NPDC048188]|uniref:DEAD/DEAH box helicase family protein n=1 Tax=Streptomyces sp. NPDC048188 TaxID=3155749 RepID=UPI003411F975
MTKLRPHQREAVDAVRAALEMPATGTVPERGLRTQVVMATGSGKTLVAAQSAHELRAGRVLVLVPSLDLLAQSLGRGELAHADEHGAVADDE